MLNSKNLDEYGQIDFTTIEFLFYTIFQGEYYLALCQQDLFFEDLNILNHLNDLKKMNGIWINLN
jgi:hypothetical protein